MAPLFRLPISRPRRDLEEELAFHLEMRTAELIDRGWPAEAARAEARRQFGDLEDARAFCRRIDARRENRLMRTEAFAELRQDLRLAFRGLRRAPAFTLVAGLTLALGIGANTAIFSVVRGILLRPLPFTDPDRLVLVESTYQGGRPFPYTSPLNAADWRSQSRSFAGFVVSTEQSAVLTGAGEPEEFPGAAVGADYFDVLGVRPVAGRLRFTEAEATWQGPASVILNETLWRNRFGGDPSLVGKTILLDDVPYRVVGVAPARSAHPERAMLWFPFTIDPDELPRSRGAVYLTVTARLAPGVSVAAADAEMRGISTRLEREYPEANAGMGTAVVPLHRAIVGTLDRPLLILLGGVGFVLLIACVNVANLLLVRGAARAGELAVRTALGAGRGRLIRQLATESMALAIVGGVAGLGLGLLGIRLLLAIAPSAIPRLDAVAVDGTILGFAAALAVATGLLFGLLPARAVVRGDLATTLRDGGRAGTGRSGHRARRALVVAEVALAVVLLAGAGLLLRSFGALTRVDPGFRPAGTLSFALSLPEAKYPIGPRQAAFMTALMDRLRALPAVRDAGAAMGMPLTPFRFNFSFGIEGRPAGSEASAEVRVATPDYFRAIGMPMVAGRGIAETDRAGGPIALVVTEALAKRYFPGESPLGQRLTIGWGRPGTRLQGEIVGVVRDVRQFSLAAPTPPMIWVPYDQWPVGSVRVILHTAGDPRALVADATRIVHELDPNLAVGQVKTLDAVVAESVAQPRFYMLLLGAFAGLAIVLAAVGIYGVIAHLVGQRAREIGIRMALGASRGRVVGMVMREGAGLAAAGLAIGIAGALALSRLMTALLFGVEGSDPVTYLMVAAALGVTALTACWLPARRAARVNPALTMRAE